MIIKTDNTNMAVLTGSIETGFTPVFTGTRDECYDYMRANTGWTDLAHVTETGLRLASWAL